MSIRWIVPDDIEKICKDTFQIIAKETLEIAKGKSKSISTGIGFELANGMVVASVNKSLRCYNSNAIVLEKGVTEDLVFVIHNTTGSNIVINRGDKICIVKYLI